MVGGRATVRSRPAIRAHVPRPFLHHTTRRVVFYVQKLRGEWTTHGQGAQARSGGGIGLWILHPPGVDKAGPRGGKKRRQRRLAQANAAQTPPIGRASDRSASPLSSQPRHGARVALLYWFCIVQGREQRELSLSCEVGELICWDWDWEMS